MAESVETLSDESSDIFEATFPEYRKSSYGSSEEATPDNSATGKEKPTKKRKTSETTKATRSEAKKRQNNARNWYAR